MRKSKVKVSYEPEADVLMWQVSESPIDFAEEVGNIVVHFDKKNSPVLVEILEASSLLDKVGDLSGKPRKSTVKGSVPSRR